MGPDELADGTRRHAVEARVGSDLYSVGLTLFELLPLPWFAEALGEKRAVLEFYLQHGCFPGRRRRIRKAMAADVKRALRQARQLRGVTPFAFWVLSEILHPTDMARRERAMERALSVPLEQWSTMQG